MSEAEHPILILKRRPMWPPFHERQSQGCLKDMMYCCHPLNHHALVVHLETSELSNSRAANLPKALAASGLAPVMSLRST